MTSIGSAKTQALLSAVVIRRMSQKFQALIQKRCDNIFCLFVCFSFLSFFFKVWYKRGISRKLFYPFRAIIQMSSSVLF